MDTSEEKAPVEFQIEQLRRLTFVKEVIQAVGRALGLVLLWILEIVRDSYFRLLDHFNVRPRRRRASAFPPGKPKKRYRAPARQP